MRLNGLKIMELEHEWTARPVIRLDMSRGGASEATVRSYLNNVFMDYEEDYDIVKRDGDSLADRFHRIVRTAYRQTGQQVAILIDEYDSPLQHSWHTPEHEACTAIYREVFAILKADDEMERFVFITGITKFTQISFFSVLNNLSNISFDAEYADICGISKQEVLDNFMPEIEQMAEANGWTADETLANLKAFYDGYHFCMDNMVDVYNPFSLVNALADKRLRCYWASSGSTTLLPKFVDDMEIRLKDFDNCSILSYVLETSDVTGGRCRTVYVSVGLPYHKGLRGRHLPPWHPQPRGASGTVRDRATGSRHAQARRYTVNAGFSAPLHEQLQSRRGEEESQGSRGRCALQQQEARVNGHGGTLPTHLQHHIQCYRVPR